MLYNILFVLGGPGSGKGTVCEKIVREFGYIHLSAGELLRNAMTSPDSKHSTEIQEHMKNGTIVPAEITCSLLRQAMNIGYQKENCINYLIDGFPRNEDNRSCWDANLGSQTNLKRVLFMDCPDEICIQRCLARSSGRVDDNETTLKKRFVVFKQETLPIIEYYQRRNLISCIKADESKANVLEQVEVLMRQLADE